MAGESKLQRGVVMAVFGSMLVVSVVWSVISERDRRNSSFSPSHDDPRMGTEPREIASTLGIDASLIEGVPSDPLPPAGDLKEEAARFLSLDACVEEHARIDPLVGDSLRAIGYDTFIRDSCRTLEALHTNSKEKCRPIDASSLRARCEATFAIAAGKPDDCPLLTEESHAGRDPFCVAVAARDARLCASLGPGDRARCDGALARSARECGKSDSCRRDVQRIGPLVANDVAPGKPFAPAHAMLTIDGENGTESPSVTNDDMTSDVARGVVLVKARDRMIIELGHFGRNEFAPPTTNLRAALLVSARDAGLGTLEKFEIDIPNTATVIFPGGHVEGIPKFDALDPKRGAPVSFTLDIHLTIATRSYHVTFRAETFVRDVVMDDKAMSVAPELKVTTPSRDPRLFSRDE